GEPIAAEREPALPSPTAPPGLTKEEYPQGLQGQVVDRNQRPLAGVRVFLVESPRNEALSLPALREQNLLLGPVAETLSTADGRFALGLALPNDRLYELRFLASGLADARVGDLRVLPDIWHDVGRIAMSPGATVRGRVTVEGSHAPVPRAVVTVAARSTFVDSVLRGIPGRETGLSAIARADGSYEIHNAPALANVQVFAAAPGFARVIRNGVNLATATAVEVDFALPPGLAIAGRVVDDRGQPIAAARIEAWAAATSLPPCVAQSLADGTFEVVGLRPGPQRLQVSARGYHELELTGIAAGEREVAIALRPRASVRVRVTGDGAVIRIFRLGVRRCLSAGARDEQPAPFGPLGRVRELPDQRVRLAPQDDRVEVTGLPIGEFAVQITAEGYAKTVSSSFTIDENTTTLDVDVELLLGAAIRGRVVDENGAAIQGATVATQPQGAAPDDPVWRLLAAAVSDRITEQQVETDADGRFALHHLALGNYQLQIDHPDACRTVVPELTLHAPEPRDLGAIRLPAGALVFGRATVDGRVAGQVKVVLTSVADRIGNGGAAAGPATIRLETVTDDTGAFTLPRRVPPGNYELRGAAVNPADPDTQAFAQLAQMRKSAQPFTVLPGQLHSEQRLYLTTER
ncbi:MAG: carboxypeptidase regulatory-like domain-containing protein, partial [Planctomycetes bacterium]|nr:carboxypeptidase regulatory-like domain-containing protein [Planctomycetota bacterium]